VAAIPNVCLAKETSSPKVFLVCGGTKLWIRDPADFEALGFKWDKVRTVPDGTLDDFFEKPLAPPVATKASDVFLAPLASCKNYNDYSPFHWGRWIPNRQPLESLMSENVLVAGWLTEPPFENVGTWGFEDVIYNVALDPDFVTRMYGLGGMSTLLIGKSYRGNLGDTPGTPTPLPVEDRTEVDGTSRGVTFNSFVLPGGGDIIHGELNGWHVSDTSGDSGSWGWPNHFVGRGTQPDGWSQVAVETSATPPGGTVPVHVSDSVWFPWDILSPSGERLQTGDYVLMRGPIWQDKTHGNGSTPATDWWHAGATIGHEGWVEMHPIDWIVRLRPRPPGLRKTGRSLVQATAPGQDDEEEVATTIAPDFQRSAPARLLSVQDVEEIVDGRCSDMGTVIPHSRWAEFEGARWKNFGDHVEAVARVKGRAERQGRFKAAYIVSWRETDMRDQVWVGDTFPSGAQAQGEPWTWVTSNPRPFFGTRAHQSASSTGLHQHYFEAATDQLAIGADDVLFAMIYLDPDDEPTELMLQWNDGTWEHRAYWGDNLIAWGVDGTPSRYFMGPLPESGAWVRLEIPASAVALASRTLNGMAFTLWNGRATWDYTGKITVPPPPPPQPPAAFDSVFVTQTLPSSAYAGAEIDVSITMRNVGTSPWTQADPVHLACNATGWQMTPPVELPAATVPPGQTATFEFAATAPQTAGSRDFHCRMRRGTTWFGAQTPATRVIVLSDV
jgi:hypothetical protein